jgi:DNA polymerase III subunit delta
MKLAPSDLNAYLRNPAAYQATLIFGPDEGLVRTHRDALLKSLGVSKDDAFAYIAYDNQQLVDNPSLLYEALGATTLMGDAPVIAITQPSDKIAETIIVALREVSQPNRLIITAGDLPKTSLLRNAFEDAKARQYAAIVCYRDDVKDLKQVVRSFLQERSIRAEQPTIEVLCSHFGNDRAVTLSELNKLDLYLGTNRHLSEDDVLEVLGSNQHLMVSDALLDGLCGHHAEFFLHYDRLIAAGEQPIAILRTMLGIVQKLLEAKHMQQAEKLSALAAIKKLRPPIYFKDEPRYIKALNRYSSAGLVQLTQRIQYAELSIKHSALHSNLILPDMMGRG